MRAGSWYGRGSTPSAPSARHVIQPCRRPCRHCPRLCECGCLTRQRRYPSDLSDAQWAVLSRCCRCCYGGPRWAAGRAALPPGHGRRGPVPGRQRDQVAGDACGLPALADRLGDVRPLAARTGSPAAWSMACARRPAGRPGATPSRRRAASTPSRCTSPPRASSRPRPAASTATRTSTAASATSWSTPSACSSASSSPRRAPRTGRRRHAAQAAPAPAGGPPGAWSGPTRPTRATGATGPRATSASPSRSSPSPRAAGIPGPAPPLGRRAHPRLDHPPPPLRPRLRAPPRPPRRHGPMGRHHPDDQAARPLTIDTATGFENRRYRACF